MPLLVPAPASASSWSTPEATEGRQNSVASGDLLSEGNRESNSTGIHAESTVMVSVVVSGRLDIRGMVRKGDNDRWTVNGWVNVYGGPATMSRRIVFVIAVMAMMPVVPVAVMSHQGYGGSVADILADAWLVMGYNGRIGLVCHGQSGDNGGG